MRIGDARELARRELQEPVHPVVDVGALGGGRRFLARENLGDVGLRDARRARQIALIELQLLEALPDHQGDIHC
ncbi:MAG: hypothetical protein DMD62_13990 [Gemmatimonadetes bacterium]|nr:MAG: hypothetical protein DMD62_13990 [Gemmatimonadota bacterium]